MIYIVDQARADEMIVIFFTTAAVLFPTIALGAWLHDRWKRKNRHRF